MLLLILCMLIDFIIGEIVPRDDDESYIDWARLCAIIQRRRRPKSASASSGEVASSAFSSSKGFLNSATHLAWPLRSAHLLAPSCVSLVCAAPPGRPPAAAAAQWRCGPYRRRIISALWPLLFCRSTAAPRRSSCRTMAVWPLQAAYISALWPLLLCRSTAAPRRSSVSTSRSWPWSLANISIVPPRAEPSGLSHVASTRPPPSMPHHHFRLVAVHSRLCDVFRQHSLLPSH